MTGIAVSDIEVLAEGIGQPEGPCVLPDGRVVYTNTYLSRIDVWQPGGGTSRYAYTGGAPNSCALGADGYIYIANCPTAGSWIAPDRLPACLQRAAPDGRVEIVATDADGIPFDGLNDLAFGPDGRLYFTDSGDWAPDKKPHPGRICMMGVDGAAHVLDELDHTYPNGIVAEPDGGIVWVESYTLKMIRWSPDGSKRVIHKFPAGHIPDGFKIDANGDFWVTTVTSGGIDIVSKAGAPIGCIDLKAVPLNCAFDGASLYIADSGQPDTTGPALMTGRLLRIRTDTPGMPLHKGAIPVQPARLRMS